MSTREFMMAVFLVSALTLGMGSRESQADADDMSATEPAVAAVPA